MNIVTQEDSTQHEGSGGNSHLSLKRNNASPPLNRTSVLFPRDHSSLQYGEVIETRCLQLSRRHGRPLTAVADHDAVCLPYHHILYALGVKRVQGVQDSVFDVYRVKFPRGSNIDEKGFLAGEVHVYRLNIR